MQLSFYLALSQVLNMKIEEYSKLTDYVVLIQEMEKRVIWPLGSKRLKSWPHGSKVFQEFTTNFTIGHKVT